MLRREAGHCVGKLAQQEVQDHREEPLYRDRLLCVLDLLRQTECALLEINITVPEIP